MRKAPGFLQSGAGLPRPVLWSLVGLSLAAGVLGLITGRQVADLTETDAIAAYAALYVQETGGTPGDCHGMPGTGAVWLIVQCGSDDTARSYDVARDGRRITGATPPEA